MPNITIVFAAGAKRFEETATVFANLDVARSSYFASRGKNPAAQITFDFDTDLPATDILDAVFAATNTYGKQNTDLWSAIEPLLPADRTHTSLSVGDVVYIDGIAYECASTGWNKLALTEKEINMLPVPTRTATRQANRFGGNTYTNAEDSGAVTTWIIDGHARIVRWTIPDGINDFPVESVYITDATQEQIDKTVSDFLTRI